MSSPPSPSESRLRDLALRADPAASARERRARDAPSIDSRVGETEEGEILDIYGSHQNDGEFNEESSSRQSRHSHRGGRVSRSPPASRSRSRSRSPMRRTVDSTVENFTVSASKTRLVRKWMVQGIPKTDCKSLRQRYAPIFDGDFQLQCPKLDETMVSYWKQAVGKDWRSNLNDFQEKSWQSVQYQMLDSFRPILRTWNQLPEGSPFLNDVEATLQLLGSAFAGISKFRRSNAMRHVAPELLPLLKDDRMFSSHEYECLFGDKFLTAMVKDADDFEKVKKFAGRSGVSIPKRSENRTSSGQSSYGYRSGDNHYQPFSSGSRSSGRSYPTFTSKQQQTSRPTIKNDSGFVRLDAPRGSISSIGEYLANRFRSLCFRMECATRQICLVAASTKRIDSERVQPQLEVSSGIRFPAIPTHSSVPIQDQAGQSRSDPHLPTVAVAGLVSHPPADGMATSTINVHRSTLSMTLEPIEGKNVGEHPLVLRLLKGCYNLNPPVPRYNKLWDPDIVLNHFATLGPNSDLALSILSKKLAMLLSLSIISRVSEICSTYIAATTKWRKPEDDSLFLAVRRPHRPVSSSTVGHWIKSCLNDAGIDTASFSAHSTRRVASCKAVLMGVPVDLVLRTANWSAESTFRRFYNHELPTVSVTEAELTTQTNSRSSL
ncbi:uncharacterized protein LOC123466808 [Daphnia magna]|uniref:uncharacterized protein LOC123466808 n=1 Tax=Daphnia magna TaxID=35525 RepID=UPI001E1BAC33|nr:uncharacterized protein LOC123466808 [Daphnia magna]